MTSLLLYINIFLLTYLSLFALLFLSLFVFSFFIKKSNNNSQSLDKGVVDILVPSFNEGEMVIDSLNSLCVQDYLNIVNIYILVKDKSDNSIPCLEEKYNIKIKEEKDVINIYKKNNFRINVVYTGNTSKKDHLNYIIPKLSSDYTAIIDVDHRPSSNWIKTSLDLFKNSNVAYVQTKRAPLDLSTLPQIWDSVQNHGGNEILNLILSKFKKNVYFTGTAAIFRTKVLQKFPFSRSITEDTELSYKLRFAGWESRYNNQAISYEEVAPTFRSYIFRRRRWSAGHSLIFIKNFKNIFSKKNKNKFIDFFHGQFYFISLAVFLLITVYGIHYFNQLSLIQKAAVSISAFILAWPLSYYFKSDKKISIIEYITSFLWLWPLVVLISIFVFSLSSWEGYYYILSFPLSKEMTAWRNLLYFAPLLVVVASFIKIKNIRRWRNILYIITYPIVLFLDIYASFLGFVDLIFSRSKWNKIKRTNKYSSKLVDKNVSHNFTSLKTDNKKNKKSFLFSVLTIIAIILLNDLLAINNCGEIKKFIWKPLLIKPDTEFVVDTEINKNIVENNNLKIDAWANISRLPKNFQVETYLDGNLYYQGIVDDSNFNFFNKEFALGFSSHKLLVRFYSEKGASNQVCYREIDFNTRKKELRNGDLYINGEKFLIKGIIPSFLGNNISLSMSEGFSQFKKIGFNSLRFYHASSDKIKEEAEKNNLMIIDQPDESTWDNFNISNSYQINKYIKRYKKTIEDNRKTPYSLFTVMGNEWELKARTPDSMSKIHEIIKKANESVDNEISSYSTYFTFFDFPIDILGINMLDNGLTYWNKAVDKLKNNNVSYYASEFGGFIAFLENTVPEIRYNRILNEWNSLIESGSIGANFFQSHDNWAQSLPIGYNNPNKAEQNDDLRGFWDEKNHEKIELNALRQVLSDFKIVNNLNEIDIKNCNQEFQFKFKNIRDYNLKNVNLNVLEKNYNLGDFYPGEEKIFTLEEGVNKEKKLELNFSYITHSGLTNYSQIYYQIPCFGQDVKIVNQNTITKDRSKDYVKGSLLVNENLAFIIPKNWDEFYLNEKKYANNSDIYSINISGPYYDVIDLRYSKDEDNWYKFDKNSSNNIGAGLYYFKFKWPEVVDYNTYLIIEGSGASKIKFNNKNISVHNYRENVIHISSLGSIKPGEEVTFSLNRDMVKYVSKEEALSHNFPLIYNEDIIIEFVEPKVFSVNDFVIRKNNNN